MGFPNQFSGLNVDRRLSKSPLSQGLHEGLDVPNAEPTALLLNEVHMGCDPIRDREPPLDPCPWPNQSVLPAFVRSAGEEAPAELVDTIID